MNEHRTGSNRPAYFDDYRAFTDALEANELAQERAAFDAELAAIAAEGPILGCACGNDHPSMPVEAFEPTADRLGFIVMLVCRTHKRHTPCRPCYREQELPEPRTDWWDGTDEGWGA